MKIFPDKRLFWFLKDGVELNLEDRAILDMYVQQVITQGRTEDIKRLLMLIELEKLKESINRLRGFLPKEVEKFWEDYFGSPFASTRRNP